MRFQFSSKRTSGLEAINHEYNLKLKIKRNDWLLAEATRPQEPIIALYFDSENELKFYNLEARSLEFRVCVV